MFRRLPRGPSVSEQQKVNPFAQRMNIAYMLEHAPAPLDEVLPGLPTGSVGMLAGAGGVGKTMMELQVAMSIASGLPVLNGALDVKEAKQSQPARVVLVAAEEPADVLWRRMRQVASQLGALAQQFDSDLTRAELCRRLHFNLHLFPLSGQARVTLLSPELGGTEVGQQLLKAAEGARLVILDPLRQFHLDDENNSAAMSAFVHVIAGYARQGGAAWIFAHHVNRASTQLGLGDTAGAARGSTALTDGVRWQLNLSRLSKEAAKAHGVQESSRRRFVLADLVKTNYAEERPALLLERGVGGVLRPAEERA